MMEPQKDGSKSKRSSKTGLLPGSLIHVGEKKSEKPKISIITYNENAVVEKADITLDECLSVKLKKGITWINVDGLHDTDIIARIGEKYGIHSLVLEDILNTNQRPKVEDFDEYMFVVLKDLTLNAEKQEILSEQISVVFGKDFVLSFQEKPGDHFDDVRERIKTAKGKIRKLGSDYLVYSLMDRIVDNYFAILESIGDDIEKIQEHVISEAEHSSLHRIQRLKRSILHIRQTVWPLREMMNVMHRDESSVIKEGTRIFLRDIYDHTVSMVDTIESYRDTISGMIDIYLSSVSNKMNEVMKVLTIITTLFIPLSFVAGIYGMNFKHMPELDYVYGYPIVIGVMVLIGISMLFYFRRKKWM